MNEDLLNVMGSFSDTALDCIEKQNEEIEQLQQENQSLKDRIEKAIKIFEECKLLMPHEFDWGEQFENAIQKLKGDK